MQYHFRIRRKALRLFGLVEATDKEPLRAAFALAEPLVTLEINDRTAQTLLDDLELDAEEAIRGPWNYVQGKFRAGAHGIGGTTLGDFGEALVYLLLRLDGRTVTRVVDSGGGTGPRPEPDFWVDDAAGPTLVEVKSVQMLNLRSLRRAPGPLQAPACLKVAEARRRALRQLGYVGKGRRRRSYHHDLVLQDNRTVRYPPIPARRVEARAVLVRDGRIEALTAAERARLTTPAKCLGAGRDCWTCVGVAPTHPEVMELSMPNAPGRVALLPPGEARGLFSAYRRWVQARWSRELVSVSAALGTLARELLAWIGSVEPPSLREDLAEWWVEHLAADHIALGLGALVADPRESRGRWALERLAASNGPRRDDFRSFWLESFREREPRAALAEAEELRELLFDRTRVVRRSVSLDLPGDAPVLVSFTRRDAFGWEARACMPPWWSNAEIEDEFEAGEIAFGFVQGLAAICGASWGGRTGRIPMDPLEVLWKDETRPAALRVGYAPAADSVRHWPGTTYGSTHPRVLRWITWLAFGDPRASLTVLPDGRVHLRVRD